MSFGGTIKVEASNGEIYYKRSTDAGTSWGADTRLTNAPYFSESPSIAISGSVLHVVWYDERNNWGDYNIYYKRSTDGGLTWDPTRNCRMHYLIPDFLLLQHSVLLCMSFGKTTVMGTVIFTTNVQQMEG